MKRCLVLFCFICLSTLADLEIPATMTGTNQNDERVEKTLNEIEKSPDALYIARIDINVEGMFVENSERKLTATDSLNQDELKKL